MVDLSIVNEGEPHILLIIFNYNQLAVLFQNSAFDLAELVDPLGAQAKHEITRGYASTHALFNPDLAVFDQDLGLTINYLLNYSVVFFKKFNDKDNYGQN